MLPNDSNKFLSDIIRSVEDHQLKPTMKKNVVLERAEKAEKKLNEELDIAYRDLYSKSLEPFLMFLDKEILPYCLPKEWGYENVEERFELSEHEKYQICIAKFCRVLYNKAIKRLRRIHNGK